MRPPARTCHGLEPCIPRASLRFSCEKDGADIDGGRRGPSIENFSLFVRSIVGDAGCVSGASTPSAYTGLQRVSRSRRVRKIVNRSEFADHHCAGASSRSVPRCVVVLQLSTMTTTCLIVAYPHLSIPYRKRLQPVKLSSPASVDELRREPSDIYPDQSGDLADAILWKASRSPMALLLP